MLRTATLLLAWVIVAGTAACGTDEGSPAGLDPLTLTTWGPATVLVGTPFALGGAGFVPPQLGSMTISLDGSCGSKSVDFTSELTYIDDHSATWNVSSDFVADIVAYNTPFVGTLEVTRKVFGYSGSDSAELSVTLYVAHNVQPEFMGFEQEGVWIGDTLTVKGERDPETDHSKVNCHRLEREFGSFARTLTLPANTDPDAVEATYVNGVLQVKLPKAEESKPRVISVKS